MPLSNLLKLAAGTCPFCHQKAGNLSRSREHPDCRGAYQTGWDGTVTPVSDAAPTTRSTRPDSSETGRRRNDGRCRGCHAA